MVGACLTAQASAEDHRSSPEAVKVPGEEAAISFTTPELEYLRTMRGLDAESAAERLRQLRSLRSMPLKDLDPQFVDVRVLPQTELAVEYLTLSGKIPDGVRLLIERIGYTSAIEPVAVPYSYLELEAAAQELSEWLGDRGSVYGDVRGGVIVANAPDPESLLARPMESRGIPVQWGIGEPFTETLGGSKAWNDCTAGFVVVKTSNLERGISSNAHCTLNSTYNGQTVIYSGLGEDRGQYDAKMYVEYPSGSASWNNGIACCGGISAQITFRVSRTNMNIGDDVCKMGKATDVTCGDILSKSACFSGACTWILVDRTGINMSSVGDSGGPFWFGGAAFGWNTAQGGPGDNQALFMAQNYSGDLGFIVAVS